MQRSRPNASLDVGEHLASIGLIPAPVQVLSRNAKLDDEIAGEILRLDFAPLFAPKPEEGGFILAHNYPRIGAADEIPTRFGLTTDSTHG